MIGVPHTMAETNVAFKDSCTCRETVNIPRCDRKQNLSVGHSRDLAYLLLCVELILGLGRIVVFVYYFVLLFIVCFLVVEIVVLAFV